MPWSQDLCLHNLSTAFIYCTKILYALISDCFFSISTCYRYKHIASLALYLSLFLYQISTSLLESKKFYASQQAIADQTEMLEHKLKGLLADQRFSIFGGGGAKEVISRSTKKSHQKSRVWLDASAQSIRAVDFVLDRLYFKEQIVWLISKTENNTEDDFNQSKRHLRCSR